MQSDCNYTAGSKYEPCLVAIFKNGIKATVLEAYCDNPQCNCNEVWLDFFEVGDDQHLNSKMFSIRINMTDWTITHKKIFNQSLNAEQMIEEFVNDLDDNTRERLQARGKASKTGAGPVPHQWFADLDLDEGYCLGYSEVFADSSAEQLIFNHADQQYLVDDQYCCNPDCKCNEVILSFAALNLKQQVLKPQFAVRKPLGKDKYQIEFQQMSRSEIDRIMQSFDQYMNHDMSLFRERYRQMKDFGRQRRQVLKTSPARQLLKGSKIGRNDPCPCGSGKKYKKCCGSNASD